MWVIKLLDLLKLTIYRGFLSVVGVVWFHQSLKNHCAKHVLIITVSIFSPETKSSLTSFFLEQEDNDVPKVILRMHGMAKILSTDTQDNGNLLDVISLAPPHQSSVASAVLQLASTYQSKASDKHLHNKVWTVRKPELEDCRLNKLPYKNLGKANKVVKERKVKNNEAKLLDDGIRVGATLWSADGKAPKEVSLFILSNISWLTFWTSLSQLSMSIINLSSLRRLAML